MDLQLLAKSLGRSVDDTVLCVHMVLVQMTALISNRKLKSTQTPTKNDNHTMAKGSEGFVLCLNWSYLTLLVLIKLNWKFKMLNAINDCVAYRYSHLRGSIRNKLTQLPRIT